MVRYFAYGSNMDRRQMVRRCPGATPIGKAKLENWQFLITHQGYASIGPQAGTAVHGIVWLLTIRDFAALNVYEAVDTGVFISDA